MSSNFIKINHHENTQTTLTVGTFNIDTKRKSSTIEKRELAASANVEIFGVQEVDRKTGRFKQDLYDDPMPVFQVAPYLDTYFAGALAFGTGEYGVGIVSQYAFKEKIGGHLYSDEWASKALMEQFKQIYREYDGSDPTLEEIWGPGGLVSQGAIEPRAYARVVIEKDGKEIAFYSVHLSFENLQLRKQQMMILKDMLDLDPVEYKILVGDFNADQGTYEFNIFKKDYQLVNGYNGIWLDTYKLDDGAMNIKSIDNIIVSKNISIQDIQVVDTNELSDHDLLVATLVLASNH